MLLSYCSEQHVIGRNVAHALLRMGIAHNSICPNHKDAAKLPHILILAGFHAVGANRLQSLHQTTDSRFSQQTHVR